MIRYGKTMQNAIAALSRLAEVYSKENPTRLSSTDIATTRNLSKPVVAKVLTELSQAGIVSGSPGPGGGYSLALPPDEVSLYDVAMIFERPEESLACPFGPGWCGREEPCPLHDDLQRLSDHTEQFLRGLKLSVFCTS